MTIPAGSSRVLAVAETLVPLALSALLGIVEITLVFAVQNGLSGLLLAPFIVPYVCGAAVLLVLPVLAVWPRIRQPHYVVAAIWGLLVGCIASSAVIEPEVSLRSLLTTVMQWQEFWGYGSVGASCGLFYAYLARSRRWHRLRKE